MAKHLTIAEFMSTRVTTVDTEASLMQIVKTMEKQNISCVVVVEDTNADGLVPVGMITERSIIQFIAKQPDSQMENIKAMAVASPTMVTIHEADSLFEAMVLCRSQRVKQLAVINEKDLLTGIITYSDLVDANYMQIEMQAELLGGDAYTNDNVNAQLLEMTLTDPMLKIGNRRSMEIDLKQTLELAERYQRPFAVALIDIDYFKKYNDHYGHQKGDETLIASSNALSQCIRGGDRLYRYGGEEFLLLMPDIGKKEAGPVAERLVGCIEELQIEHDESPFEVVTTSVGTAAYEFSEGSDSDTAEKIIEGLINSADKALYEAKASGRNQMAPPSSTAPA